MTQPTHLLAAVQAALFDSMQADPNVCLLGQDIGQLGGVFRATEGLQKHFGKKRVLDTPLAESLIAGMAVGMGTQGVKAIAEFQFMGFMYAGLDAILTHAARMRYRTQGRLHCPIVYRAPYGAGIAAPEHHSESTEVLFAHIPGLRVVVPSTPNQAYHLLRAAIDNPDPVLFLEPKRIYRIKQEALDKNNTTYALDKAYRLKKGEHITVVSWGAISYDMRQFAAQHPEYDLELIDLCTLKPLDTDTIITSVSKTGRLLIVHEAAKTHGVGAEIAASIAEKALDVLTAPIARVCGYDIPVPYAQQEQHYLPSTQRIQNAIESLMEYA
jgi:2-oxoisovalerate dehydrogenase E1 component beta subunit